MDTEHIESLVSEIDSKLIYFEPFVDAVVARFKKDPRLNGYPAKLHSIKSRIKYGDSLRDKIRRKSNQDDPLTTSNIFEKITDIAGVRLLHLYQQDFEPIHECIQDQVQRGDWVLYEQPKAYTWDPESQAFFERFNLEVMVKESYYTSIHYVVKPRPDSEVSCEIQVRTLFEEIWGEIDHQINYPHPSENLACREQLRVLARLVGAGSRLADAIYRTSSIDS